MHPTVKPVALVADAIRDCSRRGEIVLDIFGGSGTTLIAADFYPAFIGVAMISLLSVPFFLKMSPDAGAEVSGRSVAR